MTPDPQSLHLEVVSDPKAIRELEDDWRALSVARGNPFITPEWYAAWDRHYGAAHEALVCAARGHGGELRGVLPFVLATGRPRAIRFAGSGMGDHFHPAAAIEDEAEVSIAAARGLQPLADHWSAIVLENVDVDAAWWRPLVELGAPPVVDRRSALPRIELGGRGWDAYMATRSRNLRSQVGRKLRALERDHEVRFRWTEGEGQVAADMATLFRLHDARWAARPGASTLTGARTRAFHVDFATAAHRRGWLRLCLLEVDGEAVAGWYGWQLGDRFVYYQAGFDPAWADRSVGFVLLAQTIRVAAEDGVDEYDLLLGEEPFKARFADSERPVCTVLIAPRLAPVRLLAGAEARLRRVGSRLPPRLYERARRSARTVLDRLPMARDR